MTDALATLRHPELRRLILAGAFSALAGSGLAVVVGYQVYELTHDPLKLGLLGLVEAIPALSLLLFGGHIADRHDRRMLVLICKAISILCALTFAFTTYHLKSPSVYLLYLIVFVAGIARGFASPANSALEGQVIPRELYVNASAWGSSVGQTCGIIGAPLSGFIYAFHGPAATYAVIAAFMSASWIATFGIAPRGRPEAESHESIWASIAVGIRFVAKSQVLVGSMALDLFAVFFGGAVALLPLFADEILHVGPQALGFLRAAPSVGALLVMLWATKHPPIRRAGRNLILNVAGFGISMIVFGLSRNFWLSMLALGFSGVFDGVSMVIRDSTVRLLTPEHLRGRVSAVESIFIGSSNELGALESGLGAKWFGATRCVWGGGILTLLVVSTVAATLPQLRRLSLSSSTQPLDPAS